MRMSNKPYWSLFSVKEEEETVDKESKLTANRPVDDSYSSSGMLSLVGAIAFIAVFIFILFQVFNLLAGVGKYDGLTAEEWADQADYENVMYQDLYDCVDSGTLSNDTIEDIRYNCL